MVSGAIDNFKEISQFARDYHVRTMAENQEKQHAHDCLIQTARLDGQRSRVDELAATPPILKSLTPTTQRVLDPDFDPIDVASTVSLSSKRAVMNGDGIARQTGVLTSIVVPYDLNDPGGHVLKPVDATKDIDENTVGARRSTERYSRDTPHALEAISQDW